MRISPFRAVYPNFERIAEPNAFFFTAKEDFPQYCRDGFYLLDDDQGFFLYDIKTSRTSFSGLVACIPVEEYFEDRIRKHERTIASREMRMKELFLQRNALIKPVLMAYARSKKIDKIMSEVRNQIPFMQTLLDDGDTHTLYKIDTPELMELLGKYFRKKVKNAYIADGHHRCVTSVHLHEMFRDKAPEKDFSRILSMLIPSDELIIHDYNRVVEILHEFSPTLFMARISQLCHITPLPQPEKPKGKFEMTMYILKEWYRLKWKKSVLKRYNDREVVLDGDILNREVLSEIFGIRDVRNDTRLRYVEGLAGIEGVMRKAQKSIFRIAFCLYPVEMNEIIHVADNDGTLPPKSTWFEPRIKNGVINVSLNRDDE